MYRIFFFVGLAERLAPLIAVPTTDAGPLINTLLLLVQRLVAVLSAACTVRNPR